MADWLKVNHTLLRSPKMRRLMRVLGCSRHEALGLAVQWLMYVDEQTTDGNTNLCVDDVDEELGLEGAVHALVDIGWAELDDDGNVCAVDFGKHCGDTAKKRALNARRTAKKRICANQQENAISVTLEALHLSRSERDSETQTCHASSVTQKTQNANSVSRSERDQKRKEKNRIFKDILKVPNNTTVVNSSDELPLDLPPAPARSASCKPTPADAAEVQRFMAGQGLCSLKGDDLANCAAGFFDDMEACGWTHRNGAPLFDWQAAARKYLRSWQNRSASDAIAARKASTPTRYRSETTPDYSL